MTQETDWRADPHGHGSRWWLVTDGDDVICAWLTEAQAKGMVADHGKAALCEELADALEFYANPETYFGIAFLPDRPCGEFEHDFEELSCDLGHPDGGIWTKPGKRARAALTKAGRAPQ